jgi:hypothetical protein
VIASAVGIAGLTLLLDTVFPSFIRRAGLTVGRMPARSFIVGLVNFVFFGIIVAALLSIADETNEQEGAQLLQLFGLLIALILATFLAFGIAASARWTGVRLVPDASAPRQILSGIIALELASLAPIVGWIFVPLIATLTGYGGIILALIWRRPNQ